MAIVLACWRLAPLTGYLFVGLVFLLAVVVSALRLSRGALLLMTTLSALLWDFFFIPPVFALRVQKLDDVVIIAMFLMMAFSMFTSLLRSRYLVERRQQRQTAALLNVTQSAAFSVEPKKGMAEALQAINGLFHAETALVVCTEDKNLSETAHEASTFQPVPAEWKTIRWSFEHQEGRDASPDRSRNRMPPGFHFRRPRPRWVRWVSGCPSRAPWTLASGSSWKPWLSSSRWRWRRSISSGPFSRRKCLRLPSSCGAPCWIRFPMS